MPTLGPRTWGRMLIFIVGGVGILLVCLYAATASRSWRPVEASILLDGMAVDGRVWRSPEGTVVLEIDDVPSPYLVSLPYDGVAVASRGSYWVVFGRAVWKTMPPPAVPARAGHPKTGWEPELVTQGPHVQFVLSDGKQVAVVWRDGGDVPGGLMPANPADVDDDRRPLRGGSE